MAIAVGPLSATEEGHAKTDAAESKTEAAESKAEASESKSKASDSKEHTGKADADKVDDEADNDESDRDKPASDDLVVTHHQATIDGQKLDYTATAGTMALKTEAGKAKASIFFVAYTRDKVGDLRRRPVTFCFNGGPGSSSVWLHLGMVGPRRVRLNSDAQPMPPPFELVDNPYSLLDLSDLVMIDPVSTGYSRAAEGEKREQFHGYDEDIASVGEFIHLYTTRYGRWLSPKFLLGESYGGLRSAGLSGHLQDRYNLELNGIVFVSSVIDFQTLRFEVGNDLPYILFLPTYAATAWYHKRLAPELLELPVDELVAEVEEFALRDYSYALVRGDSLPPAQRAAILDRLSRYTGLSRAFIDRGELRVPIFEFAKELLRDQRRTVGRFDSRYVGIDRDANGESIEHDPSGSALFGPFTAALYEYMRSELEFKRDIPYEILTSKVQPWSYDDFENRYVTAGETLRSAMTKNPFLQVYVANGHYDLATPTLAIKYTFDHLRLDATLRGHVRMGFYEAGHMMYVHEPSLVKLKSELRAFYADALDPAPESAD